LNYKTSEEEWDDEWNEEDYKESFVNPQDPRIEYEEYDFSEVEKQYNENEKKIIQAIENNDELKEAVEERSKILKKPQKEVIIQMGLEGLSKRKTEEENRYASKILSSCKCGDYQKKFFPSGEPIRNKDLVKHPSFASLIYRYYFFRKKIIYPIFKNNFISRPDYIDYEEIEVRLYYILKNILKWLPDTYEKNEFTFKFRNNRFYLSDDPVLWAILMDIYVFYNDVVLEKVKHITWYNRFKLKGYSEESWEKKKREWIKEGIIPEAIFYLTSPLPEIDIYIGEKYHLKSSVDFLLSLKEPLSQSNYSTIEKQLYFMAINFWDYPNQLLYLKDISLNMFKEYINWLWNEGSKIWGSPSIFKYCLFGFLYWKYLPNLNIFSVDEKWMDNILAKLNLVPF